MAKHVTLSDSTTEADYKELAKLANNMKFTKILLAELKLAKLPGYMIEDNAGALFLGRNRQVNKRNEYIDLKHHFIREFTEYRNGCKQGEIFKIESEFITQRISERRMRILELSSVTQLNLIKECRC